MKTHVLGLAAALAFAATTALAAPIKVTPADPQPDPAKLVEGLAVKYAYPPEVKSLKEAEDYLDYGAEPGEPLIGFDYMDTEEGEMALTSKQSTRVAAAISGYLRFDAPGVYGIDFISNDGIQVDLAGQRISKYDGRHPCENAGVAEVDVPSAGWYEIEITWFQRLATSCLLAEWTPPGGELDWIPNENTAHIPE